MKVYAYKNIHEIVMKSSSGGAFFRLIKTVTDNISISYAIYGAAWTDELSVRHKRVTRLEDATIFMGSKYMKSDISGVYKQVLQDLNNGLFVIFSGTPCQINGLNFYLKNKEAPIDCFLTIDVICHGSPNPIVWQDCKKWLESKYKHRIISVSFRDKSIGWKRYPTRLILENGKVIKWTYLSQIYIRMFFSLFIIENKCFSCPFSNMNRVSDITIGDFWGIEIAIPKFDKQNGVSLIIANSKKGERLCKSIVSKLEPDELIEEFKGEKPIYLNYQHNLIYPTEKPEGYDEFWEQYMKKGFPFIVSNYGFMTLKGMIRFHIKALCLKFKYFEEILP